MFLESAKADTNDNGQIAQKRRRGSGSNHHDGWTRSHQLQRRFWICGFAQPKKKRQQSCRKGSGENGVLNVPWARILPSRIWSTIGGPPKYPKTFWSRTFSFSMVIARMPTTTANVFCNPGNVFFVPDEKPQEEIRA